MFTRIKQYRYLNLIQDEGSRYEWCYPIKIKYKSKGNIIQLITELLEKVHRIHQFTSDGGGELVTAALEVFLANSSIQFIRSHFYVPEENALVQKLKWCIGKQNLSGDACCWSTSENVARSASIHCRHRQHDCYTIAKWNNTVREVFQSQTWCQ